MFEPDSYSPEEKRKVTHKNDLFYHFHLFVKQPESSQLPVSKRGEWVNFTHICRNKILKKFGKMCPQEMELLKVRHAP